MEPFRSKRGERLPGLGERLEPVGDLVEAFLVGEIFEMAVREKACPLLSLVGKTDAARTMLPPEPGVNKV